MLSVANASPLVDYYPGTNNQTDTDPTARIMERPVRLSSVNPMSPPMPPSYGAGDIWLGQVQAPCTFPSATSVKFTRLFTEDEVSYGPFLTVPICEVGLFLNSADSNYVNRWDNTYVAYDTFDSISKTNAFALETSWTWRF